MSNERVTYTDGDDHFLVKPPDNSTPFWSVEQWDGRAWRNRRPASRSEMSLAKKLYHTEAEVERLREVLEKCAVLTDNAGYRHYPGSLLGNVGSIIEAALKSEGES